MLNRLFLCARPAFVVVFSLVLFLACLAPHADARPNPNDPAFRYRVITEQAGRSPLPQPREVFIAPLAFETEVDLVPETPASGVVAWDEAHRYVGGDPITVQGTIVDTYQVRDIVCRLQFARYQDEPRAFYIALFKEGYDALPTKPGPYYQGKTIRVTGKVTLHRGQPNIEVRKASRIEIIEP